nr:beta-1,3-galactosyltransferase 6-like [Lytechinus pictus]XP_054768670.1 beta-1,3-galactosyltransferase 6-like [Lytechinus pictus]
MRMSLTFHWFLTRLLLCIPVFSFCGVVLLLSSCNLSEDSSKPCPRERSNQDQIRTLDNSDDAKPLSAFLVILVMSGPKLLAGRQVLRDTWLTLRSSDMIVKFVIGIADLPADQLEDLEKEQKKYNDLLFLPDLKDGFYALTQKLIEMFVWLDQNVNYKFVLKVDDDSFVRLDALTKELQQKSQERLFWGFFDGRARVHKAGKYAEADWVLCDRYLPYAKGGGYILSADLVHFVSLNAKYLKKYNGEDVSLGSWLAAVEVNRQHDTRFDTEYLSRGCSNTYLITHKQTPDDMRQKWKHYQDTGHLCSREYQTRPSYIYDWQKIPTECCQRKNGIP